MALALRPLLRDSSMKSRCGSQTLEVASLPGAGSVDTLLAGFEVSLIGRFWVSPEEEEARDVSRPRQAPRSGGALRRLRSGVGLRKMLSVGERQRLAFARVLLKNPGYVLDEMKRCCTRNS